MSFLRDLDSALHPTHDEQEASFRFGYKWIGVNQAKLCINSISGWVSKIDNSFECSWFLDFCIEFWRVPQSIFIKIHL